MRLQLSLAMVLPACSFSIENPFDNDTRSPTVVSVAPAAKGDLGNLQFTYVCSSPHEQTCLAFGTTSAQFPQAIAVGATFAISDTDHHTIEASSPTLQPLLGGYKASRAGRYALYASDAVRVLDFLHPRFVTATAIDAQVDPVTPAKLRMTVGETQVLAAVPKADGSPVAGTLDVQWTTDTPSVVAIETASPAHFVALRALAAGSAKLAMTWNGLEKELAFTVVAP